MVETILQNEILTNFVYPFFLVFFIFYAILEKSKLFGEDKHQANAFISLVVGLIFVSVAYPKVIVGNLILFLTIAIVIVFITLVLWGFAMGGQDDALKIFEKAPKGLKWAIGIVILISVAVAVFWASGISSDFIDLFFKQSWSGEFWTNAVFIIVIAAAMALVLAGNKAKKG